MSSVNIVGSTPGVSSAASLPNASSATKAFVNKVFDVRDSNQDGKVSAKEAGAYAEKHPTASSTDTDASSSKAVAPAAKSQEAVNSGLGNASAGKLVDVTA